MVRASHLILSTYGFWLPNDPRGSWSDFVGAWDLVHYGHANKAVTRSSVAARPHDRALRSEAKGALTYPPVRFTGLQARAVGRGFNRFVRKSGLTVWACSILPDHLHLVIARHHYAIEQVANLLKGHATRQLVEEDLHPFRAIQTRAGRMPNAWARGHWKVYLDDEAAIHRAIEYVEQNPIKEGKPRQPWPFVSRFDL